MYFPHLLQEIRVDCSISSIVKGRWLQCGHATSLGRPLTTMSSTSCHTIRASSSTSRVLSFRPLRTPNRKKHRQVRSTHRAPIRCRCEGRCSGRSPRANVSATAGFRTWGGPRKGNPRRKVFPILASRRTGNDRFGSGSVVRPAAPQVPVVLIATPSHPISPPTDAVSKRIPSRSHRCQPDAVPWPRGSSIPAPVARLEQWGPAVTDGCDQVSQRWRRVPAAQRPYRPPRPRGAGAPRCSPSPVPSMITSSGRPAVCSPSLRPERSRWPVACVLRRRCAAGLQRPPPDYRPRRARCRPSN